MSFAIAKRRMQFIAGPQEHVFYACAKHLPELKKGNFSSCFMPLKEDGVELGVEPAMIEHEYYCDLCREG